MSDESSSECPDVESGVQHSTPGADEDFDRVPYLIGDELPEDSHIKQFLGYFTQKTYTAGDVDPRAQMALDTCIEYLERDYTIMKVDNKDGTLSASYPANIPYIYTEKGVYNLSAEEFMSGAELQELLSKSHRARCRQRFPVPVIMYNGKSICRSATLAGIAEIYARLTLDVFHPSTTSQNTGTLDEIITAQLTEEEANDYWRLVNELQIADITLLKKMKVSTIIDLMVEKKKAKLGIPVTTSEKVDKDNKYHANFTLLSLPFPGCEFFKEFHDSNYNTEGLFFDWAQSMCDAELSVPHYPALDHLQINWSEYKKWDLIEMTQNYIKYILKYAQDNENGILIHCISGWDRTPLFISLLRMSLWADGVIHKSLNTQEMLFFTLAYDWMLFGHHLTDRLSKNEDILLFCFTVLKYLMEDNFSVFPRAHSRKYCGSTTDLMGNSPEEKTERFYGLDELEILSSKEYQPGSPESVSLSSETGESVYYPAQEDFPDDLWCSPLDLSITGKQSSSFMEVEPPKYEPIPGTSSMNTDPIPGSSSGADCSIDWEVVSDTGSLRGCASDVDPMNSEDFHDIVDEYSRRGKLTNIRRLFYRCYYQTLTEKHVRYTNVPLLRSLIRNLSDIAQGFKKNY